MHITHKTLFYYKAYNWVKYIYKSNTKVVVLLSVLFNKKHKTREICFVNELLLFHMRLNQLNGDFDCDQELFLSLQLILKVMSVRISVIEYWNAFKCISIEAFEY
jgi:hypothetical protein